MKFLIIGDLHGVKPVIHTNNFDAVIAPGDFCGDDIRPYIKKWIDARSKNDLDQSLDFDDFCPIKTQEKLHKLSLKKGRKILEKLNKIGKPIFLVPGNWDPTIYEDGLKQYNTKKNSKNDDWFNLLKNLKNLNDVENKSANFKEISIIGHGSTSAPEPLKKTKFDFENNLRVDYFKKIISKLSKFFEKNKKLKILISHNVPYNTKLDLVNAPGTYAHNKHYGSKIARKLIEKYQPILCVGGHIHEGHGKTKIGDTICINAGFGGDVNTIVEIDTKLKKVINIEFLGKNKV